MKEKPYRYEEGVMNHGESVAPVVLSEDFPVTVRAPFDRPVEIVFCPHRIFASDDDVVAPDEGILSEPPLSPR